MKTLIKNATLAFMFIVLFASCDKEDEGINSSNIIGIWNLQSSNLDVKINGQTLTQFYTELGFSAEEVAEFEEIFNQLYQSEFEAGTTLEFKADNTYTASGPDGTDSGSYSISANGTLLTLDGGTTDEIVFKVGTLTNSQLTIYFEETEEEDGLSFYVKVALNLTK